MPNIGLIEVLILLLLAAGALAFIYVASRIWHAGKRHSGGSS